LIDIAPVRLGLAAAAAAGQLGWESAMSSAKYFNTLEILQISAPNIC
jgi:hypothetical protein